jgi:hypothetical protein
MARGESGRIVIEVDPALKRELYVVLAMSGSTLKDWFVRSAAAYCASGVQGSLFCNQPQLLPRSPEGNQNDAFDVPSENQ